MSRFLDVFRSFKPRRQENGLDFSYIPIGKGKRQKQLAAMCEPARSSWAVLRNSPSAVAEFLEHNHGQRYIIFNLTEHPHPRKTLDLFGGRVVHMPIPDHNVPRLYQILEFCIQADAFLRQDERNAVIVHCAAGKGRTGTLICCYLLYSKEFVDAEEAMDWFARHRSQPTSKTVKDNQGRAQQIVRHRGVDQASQVTCVRTFGKLLLQQRPELSLKWLATIQAVPRKLRCVILHQMPSEYIREMTVSVRSWGYKHPVTEEHTGELLRVAREYSLRPVSQFPNPVLVFPMRDLEVRGETKIEIRSGDSVVCRVWFHPFLQPLHGVSRIPKKRVDDAWKSDKFPRDFCLELQFAPITAAELHALEVEASGNPVRRTEGKDRDDEAAADQAPEIEETVEEKQAGVSQELDKEAQDIFDLLPLEEESGDPLAAG